MGNLAALEDSELFTAVDMIEALHFQRDGHTDGERDRERERERGRDRERSIRRERTGRERERKSNGKNLGPTPQSNKPQPEDDTLYFTNLEP